jgi:hypothetical protein
MTLHNDMHGRSPLIGHVSTATACIQIGFSPRTHTYVWRQANKKAKGREGDERGGEGVEKGGLREGV